MKLMIKIPKDSYEEILQGDYIPDGNFRKNMVEAIRSGTPLTEKTDAISRSEVLDLIDSKDPNYEVRHFKEDVECLPPISSHESKTVLYSGDGYADGCMVYDMAECPSCGYEYEDGDKDWGLPFCPNCGQSLNWESEEEE